MTVYPRVGGNPGNQQSNATSRSIPAWAGEPYYSTAPICRYPVYPRVGGGTLTPQCPDLHQRGLSPRGRGNRPTVWERRVTLRSIPAWAGKPTIPVDRRVQGVYPRVGGGTIEMLRKSRSRVYPRVGGGTRMYLPNGLQVIPRGRGTDPRLGATGAPWVYPRVGGGNLLTHSVLFDRDHKTVYPRVGGGTSSSLRVDLGSIPAWAGEPVRRIPVDR